MSNDMTATAEDKDFYLKAIQGLPDLEGFTKNGLDKYGILIPYGLGAHSVRSLRSIIEGLEIKNILEIGFNLGYSSSLWLEMTNAKITTIDISDKDETLAAAKHLEQSGRLKFICSDSKKVYDLIKDENFDFIFIDGGHEEDDVAADIELGLKLKIKTFCFDDWNPHWGPGVQKAINRFPLELIKVDENIALLKAI